ENHVGIRGADDQRDDQTDDDGPWRDLSNVWGLDGWRRWQQNSFPCAGLLAPAAGEYAGVRLCQLLDSLLYAERDAAQDRPDDVRQRETKPLMLIGVEVHAIDTARRRHRPGVEELALAFFRDGG